MPPTQTLLSHFGTTEDLRRATGYPASEPWFGLAVAVEDFPNYCLFVWPSRQEKMLNGGVKPEYWSNLLDSMPEGFKHGTIHDMSRNGELVGGSVRPV